MKKKSIFLDFTSLLDIVLVILFFFVLFSKFETDDYKKELKDKQNQVAAQEQELQLKLDEAERLYQDVKEKLEYANDRYEEANNAESRSGDNADAISDFNESKNIKLNLKMSDNPDDWTLEVIKDNEPLSYIEKNTPTKMASELSILFFDIGYSKDDTILTELFYDATASGTNAAYNVLENMMHEIRKEYPHCFYSETDKSML